MTRTTYQIRDIKERVVSEIIPLVFGQIPTRQFVLSDWPLKSVNVKSSPLTHTHPRATRKMISAVTKFSLGRCNISGSSGAPSDYLGNDQLTL